MQEFIRERGITELYHFTNVDNLHSILNNGLLSRYTLNNMGLGYEQNDDYRLENRLDAICTSISFPNYKMFYRYRQNTSNTYCVIELDPRLLYEKECIFCISNAASREERQRRINEKLGVDGLRRLFYDDNLRRELRLEPYFTTNPQAEVLVTNDIEVEYIRSINFNTPRTSFDFKRYKGNNIKFYHNPALFTYRLDYEYWR